MFSRVWLEPNPDPNQLDVPGIEAGTSWIAMNLYFN
jgi:hypothetical protein